MKKLKPAGVDILAFVFCSAGLLFPSFLLNKENRLVDGDAVSLYQISGGFVLVIILAVLAAVLFTGRYFSVIRIFVISALLILVTLLAGSYAETVAAENMFARISFSTGYWIFFLGCILFYLQMYTHEKNVSSRTLLTAVMFAPIIIAVLGGYLDKMSVMQEYSNYAERFHSEIITHMAIAVGSILLACIAGVPIGIFTAKKRSAGGKVFDVLNIVQTVPSIALFGLLMAPLAWLASHSDILRSAGISGIGWAPAVIALFLYSLLPIVRNTFEGIQSIDSGVKEAAKGMGMTSLYMLFKVELPLSLPVILNGVRVALVQSIGNTAVVSLIGAGGLGIFIFQGLGQSAVPMIMLGTIPTIVMAVFADGIMQFVITLTKGAHDDRA